MQGIGVKITGINKLLKKLEALPHRVGRTAMSKALKAGGKPIIKSARSKCPKESGLLKKSLGAKMLTKKSKQGNYALVIGPRKGCEGTYDGKKRVPSNYAHLVHDGYTTRGGGFVSGTPFLKSAHIEQTGAALSAIKTSLAATILKAVK